MLSNETMGLLALGILWINTLLICAASGQTIGSLLVRMRRFRLGGVYEGFVSGTRNSQPFAARKVVQVARFSDKGPSDKGLSEKSLSEKRERRSILFNDRAYVSEIFGGTVRLEDGRKVQIDPPGPNNLAEVWVDSARMQVLAACSSEDQFREVYKLANRGKGHQLEVEASIENGDHIWFSELVPSESSVKTGLPTEKGAGPTEKGAGRQLVVATMDPLTWCGQRILVNIGFIGGSLALCALLTWLATRAPLFGTVSTVGALLSFLFFLFVQPAGVFVSESSRFPHIGRLRGGWRIDRIETETSPDRRGFGASAAASS